jgi:hypothetical protein
MEGARKMFEFFLRGEGFYMGRIEFKLSLGEHFHSAGFAPPRLVFNQDGWG